MSDSDDIFDGDDAGGEPSGAPKKRGGGGLGNLLPTILKFVAIGIGAMIFIITVCVITYNVMQSGGKSQTQIYDPNSPYLGLRPQYSYFDTIGSITTRTRDVPLAATVTVEMIIGYDLNDINASQELTARRFALRDFTRRYFAQKTAAELVPEREEELKKEIREQLNTRLLDTARVREVLFNRLDVTQEAL